MKNLLSNKSLATMTLLMLLSLSAFANIVTAAPGKDPTIHISGSGLVELTFKSGKTQTIRSTDYVDVYVNLGGLNTVTFIPTRGWHIDAVSIDGVPQFIDDEDGFSLTVGKVRDLISVEFEANDGVDEVEAGSNVEAYPTPEVFLMFTNVAQGGLAYAVEYMEDIYYPPNLVTATWDVTTTAIFDQSVTVILVVPLPLPDGSDPLDLRLWSADIAVAWADVNADGVVNGDDVSDVSNANPSEIGDPNYDPRLDQNDNGVIDNEDVNIVNNYQGLSVWEDITLYVEVDELEGFAYVYGETDHFSLFGSF